MRRREDEEGAVAVMVALTLALMIGFAALAIDVGSGWSTKRDLVVDLDAAALAGAQALAVDLAGCSSGGPSTQLEDAVEEAVAETLDRNGGRAQVDLAEDVDIDCDRSTVTVAGSQQAQGLFAGVLGRDAFTPTGYAVAVVQPGDGGHVLPLTFCSSVDPISDWVAAGAPYGANATITYGDGPRSECGDTPGAWGWFGSNNVPTLRTWLASGYPGTISLAPTCTGPAESTTLPGWCNGGAGAQPNLLDHAAQFSMTDLACSSGTPTNQCAVFTFFIHGDAQPPAGTNVNYRPVAFLDAVIRGANSQGNTANSSISLELLRYRTDDGEHAAGRATSRLCSADGAPSGDPACGDST